MDKTKPLAKFPVTATNRVDEAEYCLSKSIRDVQIDRVDDQASFSLEMNAFRFGCFSLLYNHFGTQTFLSTGMEADDAVFVTGMDIPISLHFNNESYRVTQKQAVLIPPTKRVRVERPAQSEILYLRVSFSDLWNHFEKLTARHHRGSLVFGHMVNVNKGPGAVLKGIMQHLVDIATFNAAAMNNAFILKGFDELMMTTMLSLPHNKTDQLYKDHSSMVAPAVVYRAEEYMRAHLKKPISVSDLIQLCDCSRSVLFAAFSKTRGYTPMEFLTEQRLLCARRQLLESDYKTTVSSIALNCGFISFSWFSQIYKKRFGERPSDTLRR